MKNIKSLKIQIIIAIVYCTILISFIACVFFAVPNEKSVSDVSIEIASEETVMITASGKRESKSIASPVKYSEYNSANDYFVYKVNVNLDNYKKISKINAKIGAVKIGFGDSAINDENNAVRVDRIVEPTKLAKNNEFVFQIIVNDKKAVTQEMRQMLVKGEFYFTITFTAI
ncbi:MAG: hypothetical protein RR123_04085 [Clostridia bacterium]